MDDRKRLDDLAISSSGFVFDPYTGNTYSVNATARAIIDGLRQGLTRQEIVDTLRQHFDVGGEDLGRDIDELVSTLRSEALLPGDFLF